MTGEWEKHYAQLTRPMCYGGDASYVVAAEFVRGNGLVEDWGCGGGWLRRYFADGEYRGIDGSWSPFTDEVVDLVTYRSDVGSIVLRHVLEHSYDWAKILDNAVASFRSRLCIVLFTPLATERRNRPGPTRVMHTEPDYGDVPVISFNLFDILDRLTGRVEVEIQSVPGSFYGIETVLKVTRL